MIPSPGFLPADSPEIEPHLAGGKAQAPSDPEHLLHRIAERERELDLARRQLEIFAHDFKQTLESARQRERQLQTMHHETVFRLMLAAKFRDDETGTHLQRISRLSGVLAHRFGMASREVKLIEGAATRHDIGKIGIEDRILRKAAPLNRSEWKVMERHTVIGAELLAGSSSPLLDLCREIALHHHECWDSSGYPEGVKGNAIPIAARIVMLCDQYDALRSERPYKPADDHETTCRILLQGDGRTQPEHFDPTLLDLFRDIHPQFKAIWRAVVSRGVAPHFPVFAGL